MLESGGPYLFHVWFARPFHTGLSRCFKSASFASERYGLDILLHSPKNLYCQSMSLILTFFCDSGSAMFPGVIQGYVPPYWNGTSFPHIRPFGNIYGNAGMMPFNAAMVPAAPYAVPNYMPSVYGGFPSYRQVQFIFCWMLFAMYWFWSMSSHEKFWLIH